MGLGLLPWVWPWFFAFLRFLGSLGKVGEGVETGRPGGLRDKCPPHPSRTPNKTSDSRVTLSHALIHALRHAQTVGAPSVKPDQ